MTLYAREFVFDDFEIAAVDERVSLGGGAKNGGAPPRDSAR